MSVNCAGWVTALGRPPVARGGGKAHRWGAGDERRLLNRQRKLFHLGLMIIDELGFVLMSPTGAELLFEVCSQRYDRGSILVTTNQPFDEWTSVFAS